MRSDVGGNMQPSTAFALYDFPFAANRLDRVEDADQDAGAYQSEGAGARRPESVEHVASRHPGYDKGDRGSTYKHLPAALIDKKPEAFAQININLPHARNSQHN